MEDHLECRRRAAQTEPIKNQVGAVGHKQVTVAFFYHDFGLGSPTNGVAEAVEASHRSRSYARTKNSDFNDKPVARGVNRARVSAIKFFNYLIGYLSRFFYIYYFIKTNYITLVHSHWLRTDSGLSLTPLLPLGQKRLHANPDISALAIQLGRSWALGGRSPRLYRLNGAAFNPVTTVGREQRGTGACSSRGIHGGLDRTLFAPERYIDPGLKHYSPDRFAVGSSLCTVSCNGQPISAVCTDRKNMQEEARNSS